MYCHVAYVLCNFEQRMWEETKQPLHTLTVFQHVPPKGSKCVAPSSPQCFRRNNESPDYECEWRMNTTRSDVTFDLHLGKQTFKFKAETHAEFREEQLIKYRPVDIWVEARVEDSTCSSNRTSVVLNETVKFKAPQDILVSWIQNHLKLTWMAAEKHPALVEVWFRKADTLSWEKRQDLTELMPSKNLMSDMLVIKHLQKHTAYQVRLRQQTKAALNPLWSDWSPTVIAPAELEHKLDVNMTLEALEGVRKVTLVWKPVQPSAAVSGVAYFLNDTQSSRRCPCKKKQHRMEETEYTYYVSYSPVSFSVVARNAAGYSPQAAIQVPAEVAHDLQPCNKTMDKKVKKSTCREWYELQGEDLRPESVPSFTETTRKKVNRNSIKDYVGYLYFEHLCVQNTPKTVNMCLYYRNENVPKKAPQELVASNQTRNSVTVSWNAIPVVERRGFLIHYNLCSVIIHSQDKEKQCHLIPASLLKFQLENLRPNATYNISVAGVTAAGEGPKATITISTLLLSFMNGGLKLGLVFATIFILLLIVCMCICKRMKKKICPPVPKPTFLKLAFNQPVNQTWTQEEHEEVEHDVTLQPLSETLAKNANETVMSLHIDIRTTDSMVSEETNGDNLISKALTDSKEEMPNMGEEDLLASLLYRKGLVFDMKTDSG
ncbi:oncostatin-M-specific receptor subunit beta isoform X3 [Nerophis ophidion]|uniref:oncostatin-M-specific receptor subunit beta isoform X3 n=1 Tax=Nerophis ophidion TaxID=159077 RepID=UPI002AE051A8|nr:oncostatin-M-specific receptor subunit beta isoform X3 [Nerophis ophidion]